MTAAATPRALGLPLAPIAVANYRPSRLYSEHPTLSLSHYNVILSLLSLTISHTLYLLVHRRSLSAVEVGAGKQPQLSAAESANPHSAACKSGSASAEAVV